MSVSEKLAGLVVQFRYNHKPREETARELDAVLVDVKRLETERDRYRQLMNRARLGLLASHDERVKAVEDLIAEERELTGG